MSFFSKHIDKVKKALKNGERKDGPSKAAIRGLRHHRMKRDPEDNQKSAVPEDVRIYMPSLWVIEAYPPTFINNLIDGLKKGDFVEQHSRIHNRNILDQINLMRSVGFRNNWYHLGIFASKDSSMFPTMNANIPEGVSHISSYLHQFVPSTTILASQFYLNKDLQKTIEEPLSKDYQTVAIVNKDRTRYNSVIHQKQDAYLYQMEFIRTLCSNWVDSSFPGLFSSDLIKRNHPTSELILFEADDPIEGKQNPYGSYKNIMGFKSDFDMYQSSDLKDFVMTLDEKYSSNRSSILFGGNIDKVLSDKKLEAYGGSDKVQRIAGWSYYLHKTLSFWSLTDIVFEYYRKQNNLRDKLGAIDHSSDENALFELQNIENELIELQANSIPLANELYSVIDEKGFDYDLFDFAPIAKELRGKKTFIELRKDLLKRKALSIIENDKQITRITSSLTNLITGQINLKLSESNNKLQKRIFWLTLLAVIIAVFSFFDITDSKLVSWVKSLYK
ncbi:hypothetical protein [Gracilimonas sp.]|uniref:hypothetical protein n=1 Tax=Gracilimonas sp. TaxID=1974203 RepID=UPI003D0E6A6F